MFNYVKCLLIVFALLLSLFAKNTFADTTWTCQILETKKNLRCINKCNDRFIIVGDSGTMASSVDCHTWSIIPTSTEKILRSVCFGNGIYVAVGDSGTIISSADGISWNNQNSGTTTDFKSVIFGNEIFLAYGDDRNTKFCNVLFISRDGVNWKQEIPDSAEYVSSFGTAVYADGRFLLPGFVDAPDGPMCGQCKFFSSVDGDTWTSYDFFASYESLTAFSYVNNKYIACTYDEMHIVPQTRMLISDNGVDWHSRKDMASDMFGYSVIAYGDAGFVALDGWTMYLFLDADAFVKEKDCIETQITSSLSINSEIKSLIWNGKEYVAVGTSGGIFSWDPQMGSKPFSRNIKSSKIPTFKVEKNSFVYQTSGAANFEMSIFDLHGKLLYKKGYKYSEQGVFHEKIPLGIVSGTYLARFKTAKQNSAVKFVVDKHN